MPLLTIERISPLPVREAWRRLTDWHRHADVVPLTRVDVTTPPPTHIGTLFVARTGVGPVRFDDPMEVVEWQPPESAGASDSPGGASDTPGRCRLEKRGSLVLGWAEIEVAPHGSGSSVLWRESLGVRFLPPLFDTPLAAAGRHMFGRAVDGLLAEGAGS
ncbi:Immediate-early protein 2 [Streptomyces tsukubensis]|uniref:Immediate-early protein 2 n=1 Tax=Streptomyces tsukubensis TaxID=83656 RepID=A0A1V4A6N0_9ACTN|nr:Immediate-early protein 2 [Streptomyces tsukubensis]OON77408.1 Immediate-early protein 2 [Streptomyces tsukubensis]QFR92423.1 SRPBCC family protein [Streptomyces tsukubensis]